MARLLRHTGGIAAVEFALIAPVLLLILLGTVQFGIALNNYLELTGAVGSGALEFSMSRSATTPYTATTTAITSSLSNLTAKNIKLTLQVNGTACSTDAGCASALSAGEGGTAIVQATYPCNLTVMGVNFAPNCTLSSVASGMIQ